jgi:peroxiredoxin
MTAREKRISALSRRTRIGLALLALCCAMLAIGCTSDGETTSAPQAPPELGLNKGQLAPHLQLESLDGREIRLSDYRGQVVLINFWTTWCIYCRTEFPLIQEAYARNQEQGFVVLAINVQELSETAQAYVQEQGLTFPILLDLHGEMSDRYRANNLPTSYVIDREGVIALKKVGALDRATLDRVLAQTGVE